MLFSGYNQIKMSLADEVHTSSSLHYCYKVMPFGIKNDGAIFQRMVTEVFKPQIGRNIEVYVDNMIVKTKVVADYLFGAVSGKFLGFLISKRRVEANSEKIRVVLDMRPPSTVKDV